MAQMLRTDANDRVALSTYWMYDASDCSICIATLPTVARRLPGDGAETEVFFSDLSHDYVTINAEYTT